MRCVFHLPEDSFPVVLDVNGLYIHAGCHHLVGRNLGKVDRRLNQFRAIFIQDLFILRRFDPALQLFHRFLIILFLRLHPEGQQAYQADRQPDQRAQHNSQDSYRPGIALGNTVGVLLGDDFGNGLTEDNHQQGKYQGCRPGPVVTACHQDNQDRGQ